MPHIRDEQERTACLMLLLRTLEHIQNGLFVQLGEIAGTINPDQLALAQHGNAVLECFNSARKILKIKEGHFWNRKLVSAPVRHLHAAVQSHLGTGQQRVQSYLIAEAERISRKYPHARRHSGKFFKPEMDECSRILQKTAERITRFNKMGLAVIGKAEALLARRLPKKPRVFIGSSSETLPWARGLCRRLATVGKATLWKDDKVFAPGTTGIGALVAAADQYHFAVFICGADDHLRMRHRQQDATRDNVIFEIGLFMGRLPFSRVLLVHERGVRLPSDLSGVNCAEFEQTASSKRRNQALDAIYKKVLEAIQKEIEDSRT